MAFDGGKLRARRERCGYSQERLAELAGVGPRVIRYLEKGERQPHGETRRRLAEALDCDLDEFELDVPIASAGPEAQAERPLPTRQLPEPPRDFVGRASELAELERACADGARMLGIFGMGGVGKTALACALAERLAVTFPDGAVYLDLAGSNPSWTATRAMSHILHSIRPGSRIGEDEAWIAGTYRSALSESRALLLLENTSDPALLEALRPPRGNLLIATSRLHVALEGLTALHLTPLERPAARQLVSRLAPVEDEVAEALADLCGDLPLALVLATRALARRDRSPREYLAELTSESDRLRHLDGGHAASGVAASLRRSFLGLPERLRARFLLLCVFPAGFDRSAAASVWSESDLGSRQDLGRLLDLNLLELMESQGSETRYRMHDLVRLFAASEIDAELRREGEQRHAAHYLKVLEQADSGRTQQEARQSAALALLDRELIHVEHAFEWALRNARSRPAAALCSRFPVAKVLEIRHPARKRLAWCTGALRSAARRQERALVAALHERCATAHRDMGALREAERSYRRALELGKGPRGRRPRVDASLGLGITFCYLGESRRAVQSLTRSLAGARTLGERSTLARALRHLGVANYMTGELRTSSELLEESLEIAGHDGDRLAEARALVALGNVERALGDAARSRTRSQQALKLAVDFASGRDELQARICLAFSYVELREIGEAEEHFERSLALARELHDQRCEAQALGLGGVVAGVRGDLPSASARAAESLSLAQQIGDRYLHSWNLHTQGTVLRLRNEDSRAIHHYRRWRQTAQRIADRRGVAAASWYLGCLYESVGQYAAARKEMSACVAYEEEMDHPRAAAHRARLESLPRRRGGAHARERRGR